MKSKYIRIPPVYINNDPDPIILEKHFNINPSLQRTVISELGYLSHHSILSGLDEWYILCVALGNIFLEWVLWHHTIYLFHHVPLCQPLSTFHYHLLQQLRFVYLTKH